MAVAIPKLFFLSAGSLTAVVVAEAASTGVVDIAEKFQRFLEKNEEKALMNNIIKSENHNHQASRSHHPFVLAFLFHGL